MKAVLAPQEGFVMTFYSVRNQRIVKKLPFTSLNIARIDECFLEAALD